MQMVRPKILIVAAVSTNGVIGKDGQLPWHLPSDFPRTSLGVVNYAFTGWGHVFLYDEEELRGRLLAAGFSEVRRVPVGALEARQGKFAERESLVLEAS